MTTLVGLGDPAARDPATAGVKAARLAEASAAGLPVLPGVVLPLEASGVAIAAGSEALDVSGPAAAYLAASRAEARVPTGGVASVLSEPDGSLVVRSSTPLDDDGRWSGAFASYLDVATSDVPIAVRGCWASTFSRGPLARSDATGLDVRNLRIAVLIQPFVSWDAGGTARVRPDGTALVTAAAGGPQGVVDGHSAVDITVGPDGRCVGPIEAPLSRSMIRSAASLARRAVTATGVGAIEWGSVGEEVIVLQVGPAAPMAAVAAPARKRRASRDMPAGAERLARLVTAFPGPLGEDLVLPWALGLAAAPEPARIGQTDPASALEEASALADELAVAAWGAPVDEARARAGAVERSLREGRVREALRTLADLRPADGAGASRVVGLIEAAADALADAGRLPAASLVWRITRPDLDRAIAGAAITARRGPDRWEPFIADVALARGRMSRGVPVADGVGAGQLHPIRHLRAIGRPRPRGVLAAPRPLPQLAPLLWHAAGLVTAEGSAGAHLFEVARSLGVPAVAGVHVDGLDAGALLAVDGSTGRVSMLPAPAPGGLGPVPRVRASGSVATL